MRSSAARGRRPRRPRRCSRSAARSCPAHSRKPAESVGKRGARSAHGK
jgi:hypothetical protein